MTVSNSYAGGVYSSWTEETRTPCSDSCDGNLSEFTCAGVINCQDCYKRVEKKEVCGGEPDECEDVFTDFYKTRTVYCYEDSTSCNCIMYKDRTAQFSVTGLNACSISCYSGGVLKEECYEPGAYTNSLKCGDGSGFICGKGNHPVCQLLNEDTNQANLLDYDYYDPNFPTDNYFKCNSSRNGMMAPGKKDLCAYNVEESTTEWRNLKLEVFKIHDLLDGQVNAISNNYEWFYCAAAPIDGSCDASYKSCSLNPLEVYGDSCDDSCSLSRAPTPVSDVSFAGDLDINDPTCIEPACTPYVNQKIEGLGTDIVFTFNGLGVSQEVIGSGISTSTNIMGELDILDVEARSIRNLNQIRALNDQILFYNSMGQFMGGLTFEGRIITGGPINIGGENITKVSVLNATSLEFYTTGGFKGLLNFDISTFNSPGESVDYSVNCDASCLTDLSKINVSSSGTKLLFSAGKAGIISRHSNISVFQATVTGAYYFSSGDIKKITPQGTQIIFKDASNTQIGSLNFTNALVSGSEININNFGHIYANDTKLDFFESEEIKAGSILIIQQAPSTCDTSNGYVLENAGTAHEICKKTGTCTDVPMGCSEKLAPLTGIAKYSTFKSVGVTASPYEDSDYDTCNDAEEAAINISWVILPQNRPENCQGVLPLSSSNTQTSGASFSFLDSANYQNDDLYNNLGEIQEELESTNSNINEVITNQYQGTFDESYFPDINSSFICYEESGKNYFAECCTFSNCKNNYWVDSGESSGTYNHMAPRAFGNGGTLHTISTAGDFWEATGVSKVVDMVQEGDGFLGVIHTDMDMSGYDYVSFYLAFNFGDNLEIYITDNNLTLLGIKLNLSNYADNFFTPFRWHRVTVPISDFNIESGSLKFGRRVKIDTTRTITDQSILFDDMYLGINEEKDDKYYCSAYYGKWIRDLDPPEDSPNLNTYKWACEGIQSFGWTGNKCCGDDSYNNDEFFTDSNGGCWGGYVVDDETTAKDAINHPDLKDVLYTDEIFHYCEFDDSIVYPYNTLNSSIIVNKNKCAIPGNDSDSFFCDYNNTWRNDKVEGYKYVGNNYDFDSDVEFNSSQRTFNKSISLISPQMGNLTRLLSDESCCPLDFCWNGTYCVDGRINQTITHTPFVPPNYVYLAQNVPTTDNFGVVCNQGDWEVNERKFSPSYDDGEFCWLDSQCYNKGKCYDNGEFVINSVSNQYEDLYCDNGNWDSRIHMVAELLINISLEKNKPFTVFCDIAEENILVNKINGNISNGNKYFPDFGVKTNEGKGPKSYGCVAAIDVNENSIYGDKDDLVIMGVPLIKPWQQIDGKFLVDYSQCTGLSNNDEDKYDKCNGLNLGNTFELYYNDFSKSILFSESNFNVPCSAQSCSFLKTFTESAINWIKDFLGISKDSNLKNPVNVLKDINSTFFNKNVLYNHLFYYSNANHDKSIIGIRDFKDFTRVGKYKYALFTQYINFDLGLCDVWNNQTHNVYNAPFNMSDREFNPSTNFETELTCNKENTTIIEILDPNSPDLDFWNDMTSLTRPR